MLPISCHCQHCSTVRRLTEQLDKQGVGPAGVVLFIYASMFLVTMLVPHHRSGNPLGVAGWWQRSGLKLWYRGMARGIFATQSCHRCSRCVVALALAVLAPFAFKKF